MRGGHWAWGLLLTVGVAAGAAAREGPLPCREIWGTIETAQTPASCPSPLGICFEGELRTNSFLRGETFFVVESATMDEAGRLHYAGTLTVTLPSGRAVAFQSEGVVDPLTGAFAETDVHEGERLQVTLTSSGLASPDLARFSGEISGQVCGVPSR